MRTPDYFTERLWAFVRGDVPAVEFEKWVYREPRLESELGAELYLVTVSASFSDREAVWSLRCALAVHARNRTSPNCTCIRLTSVAVVDMGSFDARPPAYEAGRKWSDQDVFRTLERVADRGSDFWWLWAARCSACGQAGLAYWIRGATERCLLHDAAGSTPAARNRRPGGTARERRSAVFSRAEVTGDMRRPGVFGRVRPSERGEEVPHGLRHPGGGRAGIPGLVVVAAIVGAPDGRGTGPAALVERADVLPRRCLG